IRARPPLDGDRTRAGLALRMRAQALEQLGPVDRQAHTPAVLARQLAHEAPAHACVAEIVDDAAQHACPQRQSPSPSPPPTPSSASLPPPPNSRSSFVRASLDGPARPRSNAYSSSMRSA